LAMQLTLDSAMPLARALRLSLDATGNAAFALQYDAIAAAVEEGEELTVALSHGQLMPPDFLSMVAVAEEGGRIVEIMRHQAAHYHEEASRRTKAATGLASGLIWLIYAGLMIAAIFGLASNILGGLGR
jgi:type II secretory pathway component PulF